MIRQLLAALPALAFATSAMAQDLSQGRWVDLTHPFNEASVYWPTAKTFTKTEVFHGHTEVGFSLCLQLCSRSHTGDKSLFHKRKAAAPFDTAA